MEGINKTVDKNGTFAMEFSGDYDDFGSFGFENPFERPSVRIIFITVYSIVFAMCILDINMYQYCNGTGLMHSSDLEFCFLSGIVGHSDGCMYSWDSWNNEIGGNSMVLFAIARSPRLRSMTNFFLANLAIADFCIGAFCVLPNLSTFLSPNWILGQAMCKAYYYIWNVMYTASIIILTVIAVERYIAIIHPLRARNLMTHTKLKIAQFLIWLIALLYNIPYIFFYNTFSFVDYDKEYCYSNSEYIYNLKVLSLANFIIWYLFPLILIGFMYYKVSFALWKTTVVSALRLQSYPNIDSGSFRSNTSTKVINFNNEWQTNKQKSSEVNNTRLSEKNDQSYSSENSRSSDQAVLFKGKQTIVIMCGLPKNDSITPNETRKSVLSSSSEGNESDIGLRASTDMHEAGSVNTINGTIVKQRHKYRQTLNSSSRRVCRARKKVIKLLVSVVITFGVCVLPHMMKVLNHYWRLITVDQSIDVYLSPCSFIVLFLNSAMNPILYALFSNSFRRSFKEAIPCFRRRSRLMERLKS